MASTLKEWKDKEVGVVASLPALRTKAFETKHKSVEDEDRKLPAKRARDNCDHTLKESEAGKGRVDIFSIDLVATAIFACLDTRELYTMSKTSKLLRGLIRHKHVVRAALMHGGHAKYAIECLVALVERRQIWIPSPLRMLRLCNGKRCENCNVKKMHKLDSQFGVFFCGLQCPEEVYYSNEVAQGEKWHPFLCPPFLRHHPRVAGVWSGYAFTRTYTERTGEKAGPLISVQQLKNIMEGKTQATVEGFLEAYDAIDDNAEFANEIVSVFAQSVEEAKERQVYKTRKKEQTTKDAIERKRVKVKIFLDRLSKIVGNDSAWKRAALEYEDLEVDTSSHATVRMKLEIVNALLSECIKAPSKATSKKIQELASAGAEMFCLLVEKKIFDFAFLPDVAEYDAAVKSYFRQRYPNNEHIQLLDQHDIQKLRDGVAAIDLECYHCHDWCYKTGDFPDKRLPYGEAVAAGITTNFPKGIAMTESTLSRFALAFCDHIRISHESGRQVTYEICVEQFPAVYQSAVDFSISPEARTWFSRTYGPDTSEAQNTIMEVVNNTTNDERTKYSSGGVQVFQLLQECNYEKLVELLTR